MLPGARKDPQLITSSWERPQKRIEGVVVREVRHVPGERGVLTEMYRPEWDDSPGGVGQVFQVVLDPGALSAWHCHRHATDRLFVSQGRVKVVLFDGREASASHGLINEVHVGEARPTLI